MAIRVIKTNAKNPIQRLKAKASLEWEEFVKDTRMDSLLLWDEISIFNVVNELFSPLTDEEKF